MCVWGHHSRVSSARHGSRPQGDSHPIHMSWTGVCSASGCAELSVLPVSCTREKSCRCQRVQRWSVGLVVLCRAVVLWNISPVSNGKGRGSGVVDDDQQDCMLTASQSGARNAVVRRECSRALWDCSCCVVMRDRLICGCELQWQFWGLGYWDTDLHDWDPCTVK